MQTGNDWYVVSFAEACKNLSCLHTESLDLVDLAWYLLHVDILKLGPVWFKFFNYSNFSKILSYHLFWVPDNRLPPLPRRPVRWPFPWLHKPWPVTPDSARDACLVSDFRSEVQQPLIQCATIASGCLPRSINLAHGREGWRWWLWGIQVRGERERDL